MSQYAIDAEGVVIMNSMDNGKSAKISYIMEGYLVAESGETPRELEQRLMKEFSATISRISPILMSDVRITLTYQ